MASEAVRKKHQQELEEKEQEVEDMRSQCQKKVKAAESQLEDEYGEKQTILREKRELERKLQEYQDMAPVANRGQSARTRHCGYCRRWYTSRSVSAHTALWVLLSMLHTCVRRVVIQ